MLIKVLIDYIYNESYDKIIDYYNINKNKNDELLERLYRSECGFQIKIKNKKNQNCDSNEKIKQLRWNKKYLIPFNLYESFTKKELLLLLESMKYVLGEKVVQFIMN